MSRHNKLALFIVPFLLIGGFVLSDLYLADQANKNRIFELVPFGHCDVVNQKCLLKSGDFKINIYDDQGITTINSTFPMDTATLFLVDNQGQSTPYRMGMKDSPYYWKRETPLSQLLKVKGAKYKLRLIIEIKGGKYIAEFYSQTVR